MNNTMNDDSQKELFKLNLKKDKNSFRDDDLQYILSVEKEKEAEIVIEFVNMLDRDSRKELLRILQAALLLKILKLNREN